MADAIIPATCTYSRAWIGKCGKPTDATGRCSEHEKMKCTSCGAQADGECDYTGQFVCGAPLCKACTSWTDMTKPSGGWGFMNHQHVSRQWLSQREKGNAGVTEVPDAG
jgi:hypothetical protein